MIEIKNRHTGEIIRTVWADMLRGADLRGADLRGADLRGADLRGAYLSDADLSGTDLSGADLSRAYLSGADLSGAYLSGADLSDADLSDADLRGAYLSGAYLSGADLSDADLRDADLRGADLRGADLRGADLRGADLPYIPIVEQLDAKILAAIETGGELKMKEWHTCETTHCRYGWAITLAGDAGRVLEGEVGPLTAGALIYWNSAGYIPAYTGEDDAVLEDIRQHAQAA